jgi:hypothetical protein
MLLSAPAYLFTFLFLRRFGGASVAVATAGALMRIIGPRSFAEYLVYAPQFIDIFNVGPSNIFWGGLVRHFVPDRPATGGELWIAITPLVWVLVGAATLIAAAQRPLPTDSSAIMRRAAVLGCAAVCAGLFLVTIRVGSLSLFQIFYAFVPGAAAIRAGYRAMIVANLFAVIAIALGCANARPPLPRHWFGFPASLGLALLALAVVEQINFAPTAKLSRSFDIARLQHVQAAPSSCRSFYVSDEPNRQPYEVQIDAMLVALERERPTINGYSGLFPPGWYLFDTKDAAYEQHVAAWIASRKLEGVCRVDVEAGTWTSSQ